MKTFKSILTLMVALLFNAMVALMFSTVTASDPSGYVDHAVQVSNFKLFFGVGLVLNFGYSYLKTKLPQINYSSFAFMAIQKEIWQDYIAKNLFKDNSFIAQAYNADRFVLNGKVVHIPQAGAKPNVVRNRANVPAAVVTRADSDITYAIDEYTTDPILIPNADTIELSYDKVSDVLSDHMSVLRDIISDWMLYNWVANLSGGGIVAPSIRTTGGATAPVGDQTGNRKIFTKDELRKARTLFNKANISKEGRKVILPSEFMDQLDQDSDLLKRDFAKELDLTNGVITRLFGWDIIERSDVLIYDNAGTPAVKLPGALGAATDNFAALFFQKDCVERAQGEIRFFENLGDPAHYGDIYSGLVRMGGRKRRSDSAGVLACVQATA